MSTPDTQHRWLTLYVLCCGVLMIVLDTTVVTVALPSIQSDLGFTDVSLVWVLNAYMLTFGGLLLLGGRLGDLYGNRRWFLLGLVLFTVASLACGVSTERWVLVIARAAQGVGGAVVTAVALALIMNLFTEDSDRAKAMGIYGFVCAAGGSLGEVLGGVVTHYLDWHWVFLINLPVGIGVYAACVRLLPADAEPAQRKPLDVAGALTVTLGIMLAVYAVIDGNRAGWDSMQTLGLFGASAVLLVVFLVIEQRVRDPLVPLRLFRLRNLAIANVVGVLWSAGMFAWFVISALYMQRVLAYNPLQVGLSFVPADGIMALFSLGLSAKVVMKYGIRGPAWIGLALAAIGLVLFSRAPADGTFLVDVLPGMLLLGLGAGLAFNPILLAAMNDVGPEESGLASGVVNTSFMLGGALGLALLASLADAWTANLAAAGSAEATALHGGYQAAFLAGAAITALGAFLTWALLQPKASAVPQEATTAPL